MGRWYVGRHDFGGKGRTDHITRAAVFSKEFGASLQGVAEADEEGCAAFKADHRIGVGDLEGLGGSFYSDASKAGSFGGESR